MIHLDTSFLIRSLVAGTNEDKRLREWLKHREPLAISAVAWAEFLCGPLRPEDTRLAGLIVVDVVPVGRDEAAKTAELFNASGRRRGTLLDCMVAAVALQAGAALATANPDDFRRLAFSGLEVIATSPSSPSSQPKS